MQSSTVEPKWREVFQQMLGEGTVFWQDDVLQAHAVDETHERHYLPDLVLKPRDAGQVASILAACTEAGLPIVPRGGGSGVSGGALAVQGGVILNLERLNRILEIDEANMTVTVETGVITGELQDQLLAKGLWLPPDPGSKAFCLVGGNLAEMAAGPKSVKYGAFRDYVLNLEVVLADGQTFWTGANVRKMACGYNLTQLMLGSEGTLGVITKVVFRLLPAPAEELLLRLAFPNLASACDMVWRLFQSGVTPSEVEFMDRDAIEAAAPFCAEPPEDGVAAYVWVGFDGNNGDALMEDAQQAAELAESLGAAEPLFASESEQRQRLWQYRHKVGEAIIETTSFRDVDLSFPRARLHDVVTGVKRIGERFGFRSVCFGHCGDGNIHINVLRDQLDEAAWNGRVQEGIAALYAMAVDMGGALSGEHGIGCTLNEYLPIMFAERQLALMREIKTVFDPKGILNPGKIFSTQS